MFCSADFMNSASFRIKFGGYLKKFYLCLSSIRMLILVAVIGLTTIVKAQSTLSSWPNVPGMPVPSSSLLAIDSLWFAEDCIGAMALFRSGERIARERAIADADRLLSLKVLDLEGRAGWPYVQALTPAAQKCGEAGSLDAFGDGTCNPPETPYMIQTGYAVACLAQVAMMTGDKKYLEAATVSINNSWLIGFENATCPGSYDYFYSYHHNDAGRFVRNTNAIMGVGLIWLFEATKNVKYRERALAIAKSEQCEIAAGNFGYFGFSDKRYVASPQRESRRIENHIVHQIKFLQLVAHKFNNTQAKTDAKVLLNAFLNCKEPHCRPNNCSAWAIPADCRVSQNIAPCMDLSDSRLRDSCLAARARFPRMNGFQYYLIEPLFVPTSN